MRELVCKDEGIEIYEAGFEVNVEKYVNTLLPLLNNGDSSKREQATSILKEAYYQIKLLNNYQELKNSLCRGSNAISISDFIVIRTEMVEEQMKKLKEVCDRLKKEVFNSDGEEALNESLESLSEFSFKELKVMRGTSLTTVEILHVEAVALKTMFPDQKSNVGKYVQEGFTAISEGCFKHIKHQLIDFEEKVDKWLEMTDDQDIARVRASKDIARVRASKGIGKLIKKIKFIAHIVPNVSPSKKEGDLYFKYLEEIREGKPEFISLGSVYLYEIDKQISLLLNYLNYDLDAIQKEIGADLLHVLITFIDLSNTTDMEKFSSVKLLLESAIKDAEES